VNYLKINQMTDNTEMSKKLAADLTNFVNTYSGRERAELLIADLDREHNTLQQSLMRFIAMYIEHVASANYRFDGRNQGAHTMCKSIVEAWLADPNHHGLAMSHSLPLI
jgi:hypothetical protein